MCHAARHRPLEACPETAPFASYKRRPCDSEASRTPLEVRFVHDSMGAAMPETMVTVRARDGRRPAQVLIIDGANRVVRAPLGAAEIDRLILELLDALREEQDAGAADG